VEVRTKEDILRSLEKNGQLEALPFMPQMFQYCGQRFRIFKRAHKTCDTVNQTGGRRLPHTVHLELRCDGEAYGGCQAGCLIFWKETWLKPVGKTTQLFASNPIGSAQPVRDAMCTEADIWAGTRSTRKHDDGEPRYICQATQLPEFTTPLSWWNIAQYIEDYTSRNITLGRMFRGLIYACYYNLIQSGIGVGRLLRWFYDKFQTLRGGIPFPRRGGKIPDGKRTPTCTLNLQPGEMVRVKSYKEILATLNVHHKNRGLYFDAEHVPYCGGTYRVRTRVNKYIDEKTGKLTTFQNESVILEGVWCQARYSNCRMFCPRSIYPWWREIWLERVTQGAHSTTKPEADTLSSKLGGDVSTGCVKSP